MRFNLTQLEDLLSKIQEIINYIENTNYSDRRQQIFFSNGSSVILTLPNNALAHLLGVNIDYLRSTNLFKNKNSFEMLKELCDNAFNIHKNYSKGIINYDILFSEHIEKKLNGFFKNIKLDVNEIEVVCKYQPEKNYQSGELTEKYDYIIVKKYDNKEIGILGLVNNGSVYSIMSNQLYSSFEEAKEVLDKYLRNQDICLINGIHLYNINSNYRNEFHPYVNSKIERFNVLKHYKNLFNCTIDVSGDYQFYIDKVVTNMEINYTNKDIINTIVECIKEGKLIETENTDSNLIPLINAFNDYLCNSSSATTETLDSYTKIKNDLEIFKAKLLEEQAKNNDLTSKNEILETENAELKEENVELTEIREKICELVKPRFK